MSEEVQELETDVRFLLGETFDLRNEVDQIRRAVELLAQGHPYGAMTVLGLDPEQFASPGRGK